MSSTPATDAAPPDGDAPFSPRADLADAVAWIVFGIAVLIGSVTMDRLEQQHINPYTVPGLLPGLLGLAMILLGGVLALRSWQRAARMPALPAPSREHESWRRIAVVSALCVTYCVVLIGRGLPFWVASAIYVTGSILILQRMSRDATQRQLSPQATIKVLAIGVCSGVITHLVFQQLFLVRLP